MNALAVRQEKLACYQIKRADSECDRDPHEVYFQ